MNDLTKELFNAGKAERADDEIVKVLISLKEMASDECLSQLQRIGLKEVRVEGNKLVGEIEYLQLEALKAHPDVSQVDRSVKFNPTKSD